MPRTNQPSLVLVLAVALPICAVTAATAAFSVSELFGHTMWSYGPARNLAEAAALGSASDVMRRLEAGEDPAALVPVRPYVISSSVTRVTALEAAVWHRSAALMLLLDRSGAITSDDSRRHLACLASDLRVDEIVRFLNPAGAPACVPEETLNRIIARSHEP